jgi:pimeloyl-ACP methyl ester carboxylesterase
MGDYAPGNADRVTAPDGTPVAYWTSGAGPALVLVHGTTSDHTTFDELGPHLARSRTVIAVDRRGRGQSGDSAGAYHLEREFDDVAAVIDRIAAERGHPVDVFSHSFGAFVALGSALRTPAVRALVAYSPGFGAAYPPGSLERIENATASGDPDAVLQVMFQEIIGMTDEEIQSMRRSPVWNVRLALAGTIARECRADESFLRTNATALREVTCPVLVLSGTTNTAPKRELALRLSRLLPTSALYELPGVGHVAHHFAAAELSRICLRFFDDPGTAFRPVTSAAFPASS